MATVAPAKTPSRGRHARPPITPSAITLGLNSLSLSPTKSSKGANSYNAQVDSSNPFIDRKQSPIKTSKAGKGSDFDNLAKEAKRGIIRPGETKFNVITNDYIPQDNKTSPRKTKQRSSSQSSKFSSSSSTSVDQRMIPQSNPGSSLAPTVINSASPSHTARLAENMGINVNQRILRFHQQGPTPTSDPSLALQRQLARPLYQRPGAGSTSTGSTTNKARVIPTTAQRVLDAPGMIDDFYLNLISWGSTNHLAVALCESAYIWNAEGGSVDLLGSVGDNTYISSVDFTADGAFLAIGCGSGTVEVWDMETSTKLRTMAGHQAQVASLGWNAHLVASGCADGSIWYHDVRVANHKVMELHGHDGEICGLKWRPDGELLASGANDNVLNVWDGRAGSVGEAFRGTPKFTKNNHTAAVKAIAWCPWQNNLLATGGGTGDANIHFWAATTGARVNTIQTPTQISSLQFSPNSREILSTHGAPTNSIMIHAYPTLAKIADIRDAHDARVLCSAVSPLGDVVCTSAGDENIKFWKIWDVPKKTKSSKSGTAASGGSGMLMIR